MRTWTLRLFFSASERLTRSATKRKRRPGFVTTETAYLHLRKASFDEFLCSTSNSFSNNSIFILICCVQQFSLSLSLSECLICRIWRKQSLHLIAEAGAWEQRVSISVNSYYKLMDHLSFFRLYHPTPLQVLQIQYKQTCQLVFGSLLFLSVFKWNRALHLTVINFFNMMQHNLDFKLSLTVMLKISAHWFGLSLLLYFFFSILHISTLKKFSTSAK